MIDNPYQSKKSHGQATDTPRFATENTCAGAFEDDLKKRVTKPEGGASGTEDLIGGR